MKFRPKLSHEQLWGAGAITTQQQFPVRGIFFELAAPLSSTQVFQLIARWVAFRVIARVPHIVRAAHSAAMAARVQRVWGGVAM